MNFEEILNGKASGDKHSNVNFPLVKIEFIIIHMGIAIMLIIERFISNNFSINKMWFFFWFIYILQKMDFRKEYIRRYISKTVVLLIFAFLPIIFINQKVIDLKGIFGWIKYIVAYITTKDIIIIMYGIGAMFAIGRLYSLDVLWISKKFPKRIKSVFLAIMVTYFVCKRFLSHSLKEIFDSAHFKMKLLKSSAPIQRWMSFIGALAKQIIPKFQEVAQVTEMILDEREMLKDRRNQPIWVHLTVEDYIAGLVGLAIFIYITTILFL